MCGFLHLLLRSRGSDTPLSYKAFEAKLQEDPSRPLIGIIDCERNPNASNTFDTRISYGRLRTLRTKSGSVWLLPAPCLKAEFGEHGRRVSRDEKIRCSGYSPAMLEDLNDIEVNKAIGNTIPPPLAGCVLVPILRAWIKFETANASTPSQSASA